MIIQTECWVEKPRMMPVAESASTDQGWEGALSTLSGAWPISLGFLRFKGLGCRSIGCQSCRKIPVLNRTAMEVRFMFAHLYPSEGCGILTGEKVIQSTRTVGELAVVFGLGKDTADSVKELVTRRYRRVRLNLVCRLAPDQNLRVSKPYYQLEPSVFRYPVKRLACFGGGVA